MVVHFGAPQSKIVPLVRVAWLGRDGLLLRILMMMVAGPLHLSWKRIRSKTPSLISSSVNRILPSDIPVKTLEFCHFIDYQIFLHFLCLFFFFGGGGGFCGPAYYSFSVFLRTCLCSFLSLVIVQISTCLLNNLCVIWQNTWTVYIFVHLLLRLLKVCSENIGCYGSW